MMNLVIRLTKDSYKMRLRGLLILMLAILAVVPAAAQSEFAFIRVGHFVSDGPVVDVYVDGELSAAEGLAFGDVSPWMAVPAGTDGVAVTVQGQTVDTAIASVAGLELAAGTWVTVSVIGTLADDTLALQPAFEDYRTAVKDGTARVTLFHAMNGMSGVDLVRGGTSMIDTVAFPNPERNSDGAASVDLLAGTVDFAITGATNNSAVIVNIPETELPDGGFTSLFIYGTLNEPLYSVQVVTPEEVTLVGTGSALTTETFVFDPEAADGGPVFAEGTVAFIRAGHFGADAPAVDVYLDDEATSITALEFGTVTDWIAVPAGEYTVNVTTEGGTPDKAVISLEGLELAPDSWTTLSAVGSLGADTLTLQAAVEDYKTAIEAGKTRISVFHAMEGMSGVDLVRAGVSLLDTVAYPNPARGNDGQASVDAASGTVDLAITAAGRADAVIAALPAVELVPQGYVAIFVYGTLDAPLSVVVPVTAADVTLLRRTN